MYKFLNLWGHGPHQGFSNEKFTTGKEDPSHRRCIYSWQLHRLAPSFQIMHSGIWRDFLGCEYWEGRLLSFRHTIWSHAAFKDFSSVMGSLQSDLRLWTFWFRFLSLINRWLHLRPFKGPFSKPWNQISWIARGKGLSSQCLIVTLDDWDASFQRVVLCPEIQNQPSESHFS